MKMLSHGATGPEVSLFQALLNVRPPSALPPLQVDGIFGPKTVARVKEFQQKNGLQVDGIVGPQTSAALRTIPKPSDRLAFLCGNGDPANRGIAASIRQAVLVLDLARVENRLNPLVKI